MLYLWGLTSKYCVMLLYLRVLTIQYCVMLLYRPKASLFLICKNLYLITKKHMWLINITFTYSAMLDPFACVAYKTKFSLYHLWKKKVVFRKEKVHLWAYMCKHRRLTWEQQQKSKTFCMVHVKLIQKQKEKANTGDVLLIIRFLAFINALKLRNNVK